MPIQIRWAKQTPFYSWRKNYRIRFCSLSQMKCCTRCGMTTLWLNSRDSTSNKLSERRWTCKVILKQQWQKIINSKSSSIRRKIWLLRSGTSTHQKYKILSAIGKDTGTRLRMTRRTRKNNTRKRSTLWGKNVKIKVKRIKHWKIQYKK